MNYSMYLCLALATLGHPDCAEETRAEPELDDVLEPVVQRLRQVLQDFSSQPASPKAAFALEQQVRAELQELGRIGVEWAYNHVEPSRTEELPQHVEFEAGVYTRLKRKTPQDVATSFGKIRWWRVGYRPTQKTGDATIFPLAGQLGIVAGATPALAERAAYYQAEAGATQRHTLQRLKHEHGVDWGVKKLRQVIDRVAEDMAAERHEVQVNKLLQWLEQAWSSKGKTSRC
jgi:hypothetical protein